MRIPDGQPDSILSIFKGCDSLGGSHDVSERVYPYPIPSSTDQ